MAETKLAKRIPFKCYGFGEWRNYLHAGWHGHYWVEKDGAEAAWELRYPNGEVVELSSLSEARSLIATKEADRPSGFRPNRVDL